MLTLVRNPKRDGIKLTATGSNVIVTKSGWRVTNFVGDDGNEYERAEKNGFGISPEGFEELLRRSVYSLPQHQDVLLSQGGPDRLVACPQRSMRGEERHNAPAGGAAQIQ